MKLYYSPGACSLAAHIALRESGVTFDLEKVDLGQHKTASGGDYYRTNPKGYVPALKLDDGGVLSEAGVVLQYIADKKPESGLAPKSGTMERYRLMEWLTFISSEIHKTSPRSSIPKRDRRTRRKRNLRSDLIMSKSSSQKDPGSWEIRSLWLMRISSWSRTGPTSTKLTFPNGRSSRTSWRA